MKYFIIDGRIDKSVLERFADFFNSYQKEECTITLNSGGGDTYVMVPIIHMINSMSKATLLIQSVYSAAFIIAYKTKCNKLLMSASKGMHHFSTAPVTINHKGDICYLEDKCLIKNLHIDRKDCDGIAKKVMTEKEFKKYKKDRDIYFDFKRMKEIFHDAKVIG